MEQRYRSLEKCFSVRALKSVWKKYVRPGLRGQVILDLHDYYDFHSNINDVADQIKQDVCQGKYTPQRPFSVRLEKAKGLTRRLTIPTPEDAIVLQNLSELLFNDLIKAQPSNAAYYSRSHAQKPHSIELDDGGEYFWFPRWLEFSGKRLNLTTAYTHLAITDIANYFDSIDFQQLRNVISAHTQVDEAITDFLFFMIDGVSWKPDYLPFPGRGLPQVNFDAPRLLAHSFLYDADSLLKNRTGIEFLRWVDDYTIATHSIEEAKAVLRDLDELLMTRGIRLNSGKTQILDAQQGAKFLWRDENRWLDVFTKRIARLQAKGPIPQSESLRAKKRFRSFFRKQRVGYWDKVCRRYFTAFSKLKDPYLQRYVPELLSSQPSIRTSIFRYYKTLGHSKKRVQHVTAYLKSDHVVDDSSIFEASQTLIAWEIPGKSVYRTYLASLALDLAESVFTEKTEMYFLAALWLVTKYGTATNLEQLIARSRPIWSSSTFLARQVAASSVRLYPQTDLLRLIAQHMVVHNHNSAVSVFTNLNLLRQSNSVTAKEKMYLIPNKNWGPVYPLSKALIATARLQSPSDDASLDNLKSSLTKEVSDPIYQEWFHQPNTKTPPER